jgi:hypothetical protein
VKGVGTSHGEVVAVDDTHKERTVSTQETRYQRAKNRVEALKRFYIHLTVYVLVNLLLATINLLTSPGSLWFYWPLMGWGIGFVLHALIVFWPGRWLGPDWEEKKIAELMERGSDQ